jgi:hypothetical protein
MVAREKPGRLLAAVGKPFSGQRKKAASEGDSVAGQECVQARLGLGGIN